MTALQEAILNSFMCVLQDNGTVVTNTKTGHTFTALVSSGDFMADFTISDQETEESIQATCFNGDCPKTGDILLIDSKQYITQTVQSRTNGPISKFTAYLK